MRLNHPGIQRWALLYARIALGAAFLSGIASRFGLWGKGVGYGNFANFMRYTAEVNSFMPASTIPFLAWTATGAELVLGIALIVGVRLRRAALGSAILLLIFGGAMAISFGIKEPLDYSVFSASAAALLVALHPTTESPRQRARAVSALRAAVAALAAAALPADGSWIPTYRSTT